MIFSNTGISTIYTPTIWIAKMIRKKKDFFSQSSTCILTEICKGKYRLIKDNIPRNINSSCARLQTFEPFVARAVTKEHTPDGTKSELVRIIGP
jgi:hypothetical protein